MINHRCRHYRAAAPCVFNKAEGAECPSCRHAAEFKDRVLVIKLDAVGDVLRSASLLPAIIARHDRPYVAWLTRPESTALVGMMRRVDEVIDLSEAGFARIAAGGWHAVYSLSNDRPSAALATAASTPSGAPVVGYALHEGSIRPSNAAAERWLEMAAFDRLKRANTLTYQRRMLDILGSEAPFGPPELRLPDPLRAAAAARVAALFPGPRRPRLAINLGAGGRWPKKMLDAGQIHRVIAALDTRVAADVMLLGGAGEQAKAEAVLARCGTAPRVQAVLTPGSVPDFVAVLAQADALLCGDTLALHVATALGVPTVAVFGPTSAPEIADFDGLVTKVLAPGLDCLGCYGDCAKPVTCMTALDLDHLAALAAARLARAAE